MTATAPILEYDPSGHRYYSNGRELRSVTTILAAAGLVNPFSINEEAAERGREVHRLTAEDDGTGLDMRKVPSKLRGYLKAWRQYRKDSGFEPVLIEQRVDCMAYGYAGTLDRVGYRPGQAMATIIDIKTGAVPEYARYQLVAYAHALKPNNPFERVAVSLKSDGKYSCKVFAPAEFGADLAKFLRMVREERDGR